VQNEAEGIVMISAAVLVLHLPGSFGPLHLFDYIGFILVGSYYFSA